MKVLFLDLDGVMSRGGSFELATPETVLLLKKIVTRSDARVVINSAYKGEFSALMEPKSGRAERFCAMLAENGLSLYGKTPAVVPNELIAGNPGASGKALAVAAYLSEHPDVTKWAVLDDMALRGCGVEAHHIRTDGWQGLTEFEADLAAEMLT